MSRMRVRPDDAVVRREGRRTVSEKAFFKVGASFGNNNERGDDDDDDVGFERARASPARACWFAGKASAMTRRIRGFLEGSFLVPSRRASGKWKGGSRACSRSSEKEDFKTDLR